MENDKLQSNVNPEPVSPFLQATPPKFNHNKKIFLIVSILLLVPLCTLVYSLVTKQHTPAITTVQQHPLFSGQLKRLNQNLKIFKLSENDKVEGIENDFAYYEAGTFIQGELKGYSRIIAIRPSTDLGQPLVYILATKDYQTYILDDTDNATTKYAKDDRRNPYNVLDKSKIVSIAFFETEQPKEIGLNQKLSLYAERIPTESIPIGKMTNNHDSVDDTPLATNYSSYQKLTSPFSNLTMYFKPYEPNIALLNQLPQSAKEEVDLRLKYIVGETEVIVVDSVGLPIVYALSTPSNIKTYIEKTAHFEEAMKTYEEQMKQFENRQITESPEYPSYYLLPHLGFTRSQISSSKDVSFYSDYKTAFPLDCVYTYNSSIININDRDLEEIGSVFNMPLYQLKDIHHPLYTLAFKSKMDYYDLDPTSVYSWEQVNPGIKQPTLSEYVNSHPLLFIKDYWQRWVALGEFDIPLPKGCTKWAG